jgi:hypothetical protein
MYVPIGLPMDPASLWFVSEVSRHRGITVGDRYVFHVPQLSEGIPLVTEERLLNFQCILPPAAHMFAWLVREAPWLERAAALVMMNVVREFQLLTGERGPAPYGQLLHRSLDDSMAAVDDVHFHERHFEPRGVHGDSYGELYFAATVATVAFHATSLASDGWLYGAGPPWDPVESDFFGELHGVTAQVFRPADMSLSTWAEEFNITWCNAHWSGVDRRADESIVPAVVARLIEECADELAPSTRDILSGPLPPAADLANCADPRATFWSIMRTSMQSCAARHIEHRAWLARRREERRASERERRARRRGSTGAPRLLESPT